MCMAGAGANDLRVWSCRTPLPLRAAPVHRSSFHPEGSVEAQEGMVKGERSILHPMSMRAHAGAFQRSHNPIHFAYRELGMENAVLLVTFGRSLPSEI